MIPRAVAVLSALVIAIAVIPARQGFAADSTADLVGKARGRQAKVKSFDVKFEQTEILAPGAVSAQAAGSPGVASESLVPGKQETSNSENRLVIQGSNFRYEDNHPTCCFSAATWLGDGGENSDRSSDFGRVA